MVGVMVLVMNYPMPSAANCSAMLRLVFVECSECVVSEDCCLAVRRETALLPRFHDEAVEEEGYEAVQCCGYGAERSEMRSAAASRVGEVEMSP
jgi:hypothetical protein